MAQLKDRYAAALFELSLESGMPEKHMEQAAMVKNVLEMDGCEDFLLHPHVPNTVKYEFLNSLFEEKISSELMGFLYLAISKSREAAILPAISAYIDLGNRHSGKVTAYVVSAADLRQEQLSGLEKLLSQKLEKQVEVKARTDPSLIGGFYIHIEGRLIDRTVRSRINNMKESLKRGGAE